MPQLGEKLQHTERVISARLWGQRAHQHHQNYLNLQIECKPWTMFSIYHFLEDIIGFVKKAWLATSHSAN
ncbi:hypothetical protein C0V97_09260 [Asaia sp. W19]|nr:hypothetical protein C0V97_09260 [Asaia sp. W19]